MTMMLLFRLSAIMVLLPTCIATGCVSRSLVERVSPIVGDDELPELSPKRLVPVF